jgi:hypothetical protein
MILTPFLVSPFQTGIYGNQFGICPQSKKKYIIENPHDIIARHG